MAPPDARPPSSTRRRFVVGALAVTGLGLSGLGAVAFGLLRRSAPRAGLRMLSESDARAVEAMAAAWFPARDGLPDASTIGIAAHVDGYLAGLPEQLGRATVALVRAIEWASVGGSWRLSRFTSLDSDTRLELLDAWEGSSLYARRMGFLPLKLAIGMAYFDDAGVRSAIGFSACPAPSSAVEEWL